MKEQKKIHLKKELEKFKKVLKESGKEVLYEAERRSSVRRGQIRRLCTFPPLYFLISKEAFAGGAKKIYEVIVLSEEVALGSLSGETPVFLFKKIPLVLVCLPFWIYLTEEFLFKYTEAVAEVDEESIKKAYAYAQTTSIPEALPEGEYIKLEMERLNAYNTQNILTFVEALEKEEMKIELSEEIRKIIEQEYVYQLAATSRQVLKGKNWYGIVEKKEKEANLVLYLPQELIGEKVIIKFKEKIFFEGVLETDKIIIEKLPLISDYSFLEEELVLQV